MRLHKPIHSRHQPHLAHTYAGTDTHAGSGGRFAFSGDKYASAGAGFHQGGLQADGRYSPNSMAVSSGSYDDGGTVDPDAFLGWPAKVATQGSGYAAGGAVKRPIPHLVAHSKQVHDHVQKRVQDAWHTEQATQRPQEATPPTEGVPVPPGPAGAGVKPQPATGNAGRPNFTAPDPVAVSQEKNYAQNVTSRPATSPAKGTAFQQPGPDGGQRGQEFYGKGPSPYGAGRKMKNG